MGKATSEVIMSQQVNEHAEGCMDYLPDDDEYRFDGTVSLLASIALIASWCAAMMVALTVGINPDNAYHDPQSKPALYYLLHATGIVSVIGAGMLAAVSGQYRRLCPSAKIAFWTMQTASICWALVTYELKDYLSWKALGATGPLVWLSCILLFAGMKQTIWRLLGSVSTTLSYLTAALAMYAVATHREIDVRFESGPVLIMIVLAWFAGWTLLTSRKATGWRLYVRAFPYIAFLCTAIFTQTRSWILMAILLLTAFLFIRSPSSDEGDEPRFVRGKVILSILALLLVAGVLFQKEVGTAFGMLGERMYDDTRTGQYLEFFDQVPASDLILGRGPNGTWFFGDEEYQYFDNSFVWMAFIGGVPILIPYIILIIVPGFRAYFRGAREDDAAASALLILWGIACLGVSTYSHPSLTPYSYFLCLLAGRCHGYLADDAQDDDNES